MVAAAGVVVRPVSAPCSNFLTLTVCLSPFGIQVMAGRLDTRALQHKMLLTCSMLMLYLAC